MKALQGTSIPAYVRGATAHRIERAAAAGVFTVRDIALAAAVPDAEVEALLGLRSTREPVFVTQDVAVRAVRIFTRRERTPLTLPARSSRRGRRFVPSLVFSGGLHVAAVAALVVAASLGLADSRATAPASNRSEPIRMVYLIQPGPGGGGGGGGKLQMAPPPRAERKAPKPKKISSPMPPRRPPPPPIVVAERPVERPAPPPPPPKAQPIEAPIATVPAETQDRPGVMAETAAKAESAGPGSSGGVGSGKGTGIGEGDGPGVGPGSGGGTGGGPYRPGSGVSPPELIREVKPDYTEDARRRGLEGDVVLEIVVRSDGSVGSVRVVERLGAGLDERAVAAVRQWRFSPARLRGTPVDVEVEVAVEFKLR
jgi:protein TonB